MLVTYGDPAARLFYLHELPWRVVVYCITKQESFDGPDMDQPILRPVLKGPYPSHNEVSWCVI